MCVEQTSDVYEICWYAGFAVRLVYTIYIVGKVAASRANVFTLLLIGLM